MIFDPIEVVIDQTIRTFNLREWTYDIENMAEDIAAGLKLIGAAKIFQDCVAEITINSQIGKIPRGVQNIKHLLPINTPYKETAGFIVIDVPDGTIVPMVYQGMPLDERGYPVVPDNEPTRQALMWYLAKILILQGQKLPVSFQYAEQEWQWRCSSARADLSVMSLGQWNAFTNDFRRLNPIKDQFEKNFEELGKPNTFDREKMRLGRWRDYDKNTTNSEQKPDV